MKKLAFVIGGAAVLMLAGCNKSQEDTVSNAELNQPAAEDLNALANDAAMNADVPAPVNTQQQKADENAAAPDNGPNPTEEEEQNVDSM